MARKQLTIDNEVAAELAGSGDAVLRRLEDRLDCELYLRGNVITLDGMPGCQLWVPDDFSLPFVAHAGSSFVPLPLPAEPRYSGAWLYTQSVLLAPGANAVGVLLSNRLDLRVGVF